jgi:hypothetical protein
VRHTVGRSDKFRNIASMRKYLNLFFSLIISIIIICAVALWKDLDSFIFAWILNFMLMMSLLSFTQTLKPKLTANYFKTQKWENEGKIYQFFGINIFRKILVWIGWEKLNKKANPVKRNLDSLKKLEYGTRQSEFGHLVIFFIVVMFNVFVAIEYGIMKSMWLLILNFILNFYPIILQRYNRPRLMKTINANKNQF